MKIRNGFVSNSSSGSFVVQRYEWLSSAKRGEDARLITEEQEKKLLAFGFKHTNYSSPHGIEYRSWKEEWCLGEDEEVTFHTSLGYFSVVNSEEITCFLIELGVPFRAMNHYGHQAIIWDGKGDIIEAPNPGNVLLTYGYDPEDFHQQKVTKTDPKKWVEDYK